MLFNIHINDLDAGLEEILSLLSALNWEELSTHSGHRRPAERPWQIGEMSNHQLYEVQKVLDSAPGKGQPWMCGWTEE